MECPIPPLPQEQLKPERGNILVFRSTREKPMTGSFSLSACLDSQAAQDLAAVLAQHRGHSLTLDAGQVSFLGALALQLLIAASRQWLEDAKSFQIVNPSAAFMDGVELLGAEPATIGLGETSGVLQ